MFDGLKFIGLAFSGAYKDHPEGRKLIWPHLVVVFFSLCCLVFIAYVSYSRYRDLVTNLLPYPGIIAFCFTSAIALYMLNASGYVAGYLIEITHKSRRTGAYTFSGALLFLLSGVAVGIIDFNMNMDGAKDLSTKSAGVVAAVNEPKIIARYQEQIEPLKTEQKAILDKYTWKGTTYFRPTKYRPQAEYNQDKDRYDALAQQITELRTAKNQALQDARKAYRKAISMRDDRERMTFTRLSAAVQYVYFLQFALAIVGAYISSVLLERLLLPDKVSQHGSRASTSGRKSALAAMPFKVKSPPTVSQASRGDGYKITCKNCGKDAIMKSPKAKYCSDTCRKAGYRRRTGNSLNV